MVPGVLRLGFAQGDEEDGIENRDQRQGCQGGPVKGFSGLAAEAEQVHQRPNGPVSYTHLRAHETEADLVCRLLLEKIFF